MTTAADQLLALFATHTAAWNSHKLDVIMALFTDDCVFEAAGGDAIGGERTEGQQQVRAAFADILESLPDATWSNCTDHVLAPDYGISQWTLTGTVSDGSRIEIYGCDFLKVRDNKISHKSSYCKQRPPIPPA